MGNNLGEIQIILSTMTAGICKNLARGRATEAGETNPESESDSVEFEALLYGKGETE